MIPSTAPPFAMTRWVAQTHQNYVSRTPYNWTATAIHGFQATRQPAIWMGESGPVVVVPGVSPQYDEKKDKVDIKSIFESRGLRIRKETEVITPAYYSVVLEDGLGGSVHVEQSASTSSRHDVPTASSKPLQPRASATSDSHSPPPPARHHTSFSSPPVPLSSPPIHPMSRTLLAPSPYTLTLPPQSTKYVAGMPNAKILSSPPPPPKLPQEPSKDITAHVSTTTPHRSFLLHSVLFKIRQ